MRKTEQELLAWLVDGARPSPELRQWLESDAGRREQAAYRRTLRRLRQAYGAPPAGAARAAVHYAALDVPIGRLFVAATEAGVVRVAFQRSPAAFERELRQALGMVPIASSRRLAGAVSQLKQYLAGRRRALDLPLDLRLATPFQQRVLREALNIPRGQTSTYADVARRLGQPRAARAVGQALRRNPVPILVPCHRVLAADGSLRGYLGSGVELKAWLLELEGAAPGA